MVRITSIEIQRRSPTGSVRYDVVDEKGLIVAGGKLATVPLTDIDLDRLFVSLDANLVASMIETDPRLQIIAAREAAQKEVTAARQEAKEAQVARKVAEKAADDTRKEVDRAKAAQAAAENISADAIARLEAALKDTKVR